MEIKVGDKVRVREGAPSVYNNKIAVDWRYVDSTVLVVEDDAARIKWADADGVFYLTIPLKYLIKVEEEAKAKYRMGDRVRVLHREILKGVYTIIGAKYREKLGWYYQINIHMRYPESDLEPYTEPSEEKKPLFHFGDIVRFGEIGKPMRSGRVVSERSHFNLYTICSGIDFLSVEEEALSRYDPIRDGYISPIEQEPCNIGDTDLDAYTADLAKEIAVKVANKYNDPGQAADYAVKVAKAVVAGLRKGGGK